MPPVIVGAAHAQVVPAGTVPFVPLTGVTLNPAPLHTEVAIVVIAGAGFTVTVTVKVAPIQLPDVGVTVQVAVCAIFVGLVSVPLIFAAAEPDAPPVMPPVIVGAAQSQVVPTGTIPFVLLTGVTVNPTPLHTEAVIVVIAGAGFTVTVTIKVPPVQLPDVGVTVQVAVCAVLVGLTRVPLIFAAAEPAAPPVMPPVNVGAAHEQVVPAGTVPFVPLTGVTVNPDPLHTVAVIAVITGSGLTVTIALPDCACEQEEPLTS